MTEKVKLGYIRFGPIPKDERSLIGNGVTDDGYKCVGKEKGVSVWNAVLIKGKWCLVAPHGDSCTHGDFTRSAFPDDCLGCCKKDLIYLVEGDEVGIGSDGEPLLINIKIIEQLPFNYFSFTQK